MSSIVKLYHKRNPNPTILVSVHGNSKELNKFAGCILKSRSSDFSIAIEAK